MQSYMIVACEINSVTVSVEVELAFVENAFGVIDWLVFPLLLYSSDCVCDGTGFPSPGTEKKLFGFNSAIVDSGAVASASVAIVKEPLFFSDELNDPWGVSWLDVGSAPAPT